MTAILALAVGVALLLPGSSRARLLPVNRRPDAWRRLWPRRPKTSVDLPAVIAGMRDELLAGATLRVAFERAVGPAESAAVLSGALATCRMGGDVPGALRQAGEADPLLLSLAALWQVCEGSGAAVAAALDRLVDGARSAARVRQEVAAQLAGPRATVKVLAALPLVGVGMGLLMGADPLGFLFGSLWGWGCLIVAVLLEVAGVVWTRRLVRSIESQL